MKMRAQFIFLASHAIIVACDEFCPGELQEIYADMHDGDKKEVSISGTSITIKPSGNQQTWVVTGKMDSWSCSASLNFNVPGKPSPPPVNLTATFFYSIKRPSSSFTEFEFTDPTGTLAAKNFPLNRWVQLSSTTDHSVFKCPTALNAIYADMHDGDQKEVTISGQAMTIKPSGNNQTWIVRSIVDAKSCSAIIDFNVPGKPGPPPMNLTATLIQSISDQAGQKYEFEFTDPSGADASYPLNHWVGVRKGRDVPDFIMM